MNSLRIDRILELSPQLTEQLNPLIIELDEREGLQLFEAEKFLADTNNALFMALWDKIAAGYVIAHRLQRLDQRRAEVLLYDLSVKQEFRRRGIGRALIEQVKIWAQEVDADEVWVLTEKDNEAAMRAYASTGGVEDSPNTTMFVYKLTDKS